MKTAKKTVRNLHFFALIFVRFSLQVQTYGGNLCSLFWPQFVIAIIVSMCLEEPKKMTGEPGRSLAKG
jgi:hypothetical protein